jgi:hypothetical protein
MFLLIESILHINRYQNEKKYCNLPTFAELSNVPLCSGHSTIVGTEYSYGG